MSLQSLMIHTVSVSKPVQSMVAGKYQPVLSYQAVTASLVCRLDPLPARRRDSILGRFPRAAYVLTCFPTDLKNEYLVTYDGKEYVVRDFQDNYNVYQTCVLEERK